MELCLDDCNCMMAYEVLSGRVYCYYSIHLVNLLFFSASLLSSQLVHRVHHPTFGLCLSHTVLYTFKLLHITITITFTPMRTMQLLF